MSTSWLKQYDRTGGFRIYNKSHDALDENEMKKIWKEPSRIDLKHAVKYFCLRQFPSFSPFPFLTSAPLTKERKRSQQF